MTQVCLKVPAKTTPAVVVCLVHVILCTLSVSLYIVRQLSNGHRKTTKVMNNKNIYLLTVIHCFIQKT